MRLRLYLALVTTLLVSWTRGFDVVVIDAGHGGKDPGSAWNKLVEKNLCLDVANRLNAALKARGIRTVMTRTTDVYVELEERSRISNAHAKAVFVSIHFNASRDTRPSGFETHYRSDSGKVVASAIQESMKKRLPGRSRGTDWRDLKVLRETKGTAVLVECGFISNKKEASDCGSWKHRQKIAEAIAEGLQSVR